jgi:hypothetical protein
VCHWSHSFKDSQNYFISKRNGKIFRSLHYIRFVILQDFSLGEPKPAIEKKSKRGKTGNSGVVGSKKTSNSLKRLYDNSTNTDNISKKVRNSASTIAAILYYSIHFYYSNL